MSTFEGQINENQKKIEISIKEDTEVIDSDAEKIKVAETYLAKVDTFQQILSENVKDPKLRDEWSKKVLGFLKQATSPEEIEKLQNDLETALKNYEEALKKYAEWKKGKYEVMNDDNLSKIIGKELGVKWKEDPMQHFAIIEALQLQRTGSGSIAEIDSDGNFSPKKVAKTSEPLNIGEFLDLNAAQAEAIPSVAAIRKYADDNPKYKKELYKLADELDAKERSEKKSGDKESGPTDEELAREEASAENLEKIEGASDAFVLAANEARKITFDQGFESTFKVNPKEHGYVSVLEHAIKAAADINNPFSNPFSDENEKEHRALEDIRISCKTNLSVFESKLKSANKKEMETDQYKKSEGVYVQDAKRFVELSASIDEDYENSDVRDLNSAIEMTNSVLPHMSLEEAMTWTRDMAGKIDDNDYQSTELTAGYQRLFEIVKANLKAKLEAEKPQADEAGYEKYAKDCLSLARLFTDRDGGIDSALCDVEWAKELAAEAANTDKMYLEMLNNEKNILPEMKAFETAFDSRKVETQDFLSGLQTQGIDVGSALENLNHHINSTENLASVWSIIVYCKFLKAGKEPTEKEVEDAVSNKLLPAFMVARQGFMDHLRSGDTLKNAASLQSELGVHLDAYQVQGVDLLNDIDGTGWFNPSDESWNTAKEVAKIGTAIAVGVAVGIATGGMGVIAAALAGGAAMTAGSAIINQQGFEDGLSGFVDTYGKDMAVNTVTMGAARYLAAGRAICQLKSAGAIKSMTGKEASRIWSLAAKGSVEGGKTGMGIVNSLDDGLSIGTRLSGAALEGIADTTIGATLDTAISGGTFAENFQNNAMFFGVGLAGEFGPHFMGKLGRKMSGATDVEVGKLKTANQEAGLLRTDMSEFCRKNNVSPKKLQKMMESGRYRDIPEILGTPAHDEAAKLLYRYNEGKRKYRAAVEEILRVDDGLENGITGVTSRMGGHESKIVIHKPHKSVRIPDGAKAETVSGEGRSRVSETIPHTVDDLARKLNELPLKGLTDAEGIGKRRAVVLEALSEIEKVPKAERSKSLQALERRFLLEKADLNHLEVKIKTNNAFMDELYPPGSLAIEQGSVGNCYLLASFHVIRTNNPSLFREMVLNNIKNIGPDTWEVTIPGSSSPGPYRIKRSGADEIVNGVRIRSVESWQNNHSDTQAPLGDLILELAYAAARGGVHYNDRGRTLKLKLGPDGKPLLAMDGGFGHRAMGDLLGRDYVEWKLTTWGGKVGGSIRQQGPAVIQKAQQVLEKASNNPNKYLATANTKPFPDSVEVKGGELIGGHAYAVLSYDKARNVVQLANPHNTARPFKLPMETFLDYFSEISYVSLSERATPLGLLIAGYKDCKSPLLIQQILHEKLKGEDIYTLTGVEKGNTVKLKRVLEQLVDSEKNPVLSSVLKGEFEDIAKAMSFSLAA